MLNTILIAVGICLNTGRTTYRSYGKLQSMTSGLGSPSRSFEFRLLVWICQLPIKQTQNPSQSGKYLASIRSYTVLTTSISIGHSRVWRTPLRGIVRGALYATWEGKPWVGVENSAPSPKPWFGLSTSRTTPHKTPRATPRTPRKGVRQTR